MRDEGVYAHADEHSMAFNITTERDPNAIEYTDTYAAMG